MSAQAWVGVPRKKPGTTRIVICEEVFDYKIGAQFVGVVHPLTQIEFAIPTPADSTNQLALKKAIWNEFTRRRSQSTQKGFQV